MKSLLCMLGIHDWEYLFDTHDSDRRCSRSGCKKLQSASYDMAIGETIYHNKG